jgi:hypothetical protein
MKTLLPLFLAASAVMGRVCKPRHLHTSKAIDVPVNSREDAISISTTIPRAGVSSVPELHQSAPAHEDDNSPAIPSAAPPPTLATFVTPSTPSETSDPETGSGSESDSESQPGSGSSVELGGESVSGTSTFYGGNLAGGNCMFSTYTLPSGIFGTAFSGQPWDNAANCGACIEITGPTGTIKAMVSTFTISRKNKEH